MHIFILILKKLGFLSSDVWYQKIILWNKKCGYWLYKRIFLGREHFLAHMDIISWMTWKTKCEKYADVCNSLIRWYDAAL